MTLLYKIIPFKIRYGSFEVAAETDVISVYSNSCKDVEKILKIAVYKFHRDYSDIEKAWLMRAAFDKILGEPTTTENPDKPSPEREN